MRIIFILLFISSLMHAQSGNLYMINKGKIIIFNSKIVVDTTVSDSLFILDCDTQLNCDTPLKCTAMIDSDIINYIDDYFKHEELVT